MDLSKALAKVLEGSGASRIHAVADILKNGGVTTADDLKYFYWTSLKDLGGLSNMEVNKIMRYVQEKFPEEYEEYKRKRNEERKLQNEVEILNFKAEHEKKLQQVKMKFDEEMEKRLKEQQEMEEQLKCTQEQSETSKGKLSSWAEKPMEYWEDFKKKCAAMGWTGDDKDMTIEQAVSKIFGENSPVIEPVTCFLKNQKIAKAKDMSNLDWETLKCCEEWTIFGLEKIKEFVEKNFPKDYKKQNQTRNRKISCSEFQTEEEILKCDDGLLKMKDSLKMTIEEAVMKIFRDSESTTINHVISAMKNCGIMMAIELKYFERDLLEDMGLVDKEINKIMAFVQKNFPENNTKHKNWNCKAEVQNHQPSKCENMAFKQWEQPRTDENIEEVISEIFAEFSNEARINKIIEILHEDDITRAHELSCFDWKLLENLGLTSSEATRIMDFVKEQVKPSREKKTEDVGMQGKQSTSRAEATELRQKIDEATSNKIEDLTQTTNSSQLQEESQKSTSNSIESHSSKPLENVDSLKIELKSSLKNDDVILLEKFKKFDWDSLDNIELLKFLELFKKLMLKSGMEIENFQTQEEYSNHKAGNLPNDKFKDFNSNTSNGQPQKAEDNQSLEKQPSPHCEVIETEEIGNSSSNTDKRKDESLVKDVANLYCGRFTKDMDLSKVLAKILEGSSVKRIDEVTKLLRKEGAVLADDLKYFDWNSLTELGDLSIVEANIIMGYVQENFPEEYEEHKWKRNEERKLQYEIENLKLIVDYEKKLPQKKMKMKFEEEMEKILKEPLEMEEQLKRFPSDTSKGKASSWAEKPMEYWNGLKKKCAAIYETGNEIPKNYEKDKEIKNINVGQEFDVESHSSKASENVDSLKIELRSSLKNDDLILLEKFKKFDWDSLDNVELLKFLELFKERFHGNYENIKIKIKKDQQIQVTEEDFKEIELPIEEAVAKILEGCNRSRMIFVTRSLMEEGAQNSKELKYFNRNSLEELGILEKEEIDKILKFIQES